MRMKKWKFFTKKSHHKLDKSLVLRSDPIFSQRTSFRTIGIGDVCYNLFSFGNLLTFVVCSDEDHAEIAKDRGSADVWARRSSWQSDDELQTDDDVQSNLEQEVIDLELKIDTRCQGVSEEDTEVAARKTSYISNLIKFASENPEKGKLIQTLLPTVR